MKKSSHAALAAAAICHPHLCADLCGRRHAKSIYDDKSRWMMKARELALSRHLIYVCANIAVAHGGVCNVCMNMIWPTWLFADKMRGVVP
jgi:hypothetical protein